MKLEGKGDLSRDEHWGIARILHLLVLDEFFRETRWKSPDAAFHGGTALALARNSDRFSEDLDFMVDQEAYEELLGKLPKITAAVNARMNAAVPGSKVEITGPKGKQVETWTVRWSHPSRRDVVRVKAEFLMSSQDLLQNYKSQYVVPTVTPGLPAMVVVRAAIPVPTLLSAWADKIKAVATRPEMKWRDIFDLHFISEAIARDRMSGYIDDDARFDAIMATAALYKFKTDDPALEISQGLTDFLDSGLLEDVDLFRKDMARWLSPELCEMHDRHGTFDEMLARSGREIQMARDLVDARRRGYTP